jgi:hypothetical protein
MGRGGKKGKSGRQPYRDNQKKATDPISRNSHARIIKGLVYSVPLGVIALLVGLNQFSPNLVFTSVSNPTPAFPSEARLQFKNSAAFPLRNLRFAWRKVELEMGPIEIKSGDFENNADGISLSAGESTSLDALPSTIVDDAVKVKGCSYLLEATFSQRYLFIPGPKTTKTWKVALRSPINAPSQWDVTPR